jgi:hypothetical protein
MSVFRALHERNLRARASQGVRPGAVGVRAMTTFL